MLFFSADDSKLPRKTEKRVWHSGQNRRFGEKDVFGRYKLGRKIGIVVAVAHSQWFLLFERFGFSVKGSGLPGFGRS